MEIFALSVAVIILILSPKIYVAELWNEQFLKLIFWIVVSFCMTYPSPDVWISEYRIVYVYNIGEALLCAWDLEEVYNSVLGAILWGSIIEFRWLSSRTRSTVRPLFGYENCWARSVHFILQLSKLAEILNVSAVELQVEPHSLYRMMFRVRRFAAVFSSVSYRSMSYLGWLQGSSGAYCVIVKYPRSGPRSAYSLLCWKDGIMPSLFNWGFALVSIYGNIFPNLVGLKTAQLPKKRCWVASKKLSAEWNYGDIV